MNKKEKQQNNRIIDSYDYLANAASSQDCTGLIPSLPISRAELDSYEDVYHYQPPKVPVKKDEREFALWRSDPTIYGKARYPVFVR